MLAEIALIAGGYFLGSVPHLSFLSRIRRIDLNGDYHQTLWNEGGKIVARI